MDEAKKAMTEKELVDLIDKRADEKVKENVVAMKAEVAEYQKGIEAKYAEVHKQQNDPAEDKKKGITPAVRFGRFVKALAAGRGDRQTTVEFAKKMYEGDAVSIGYVEKAMGATVPADGGYFVPNVLASEVIPYLYNKIVVRNAGARVVPMPNGNMTVSRFDAKATGYWIGENAPITKSQSTIGSVKLNAKKAAGLVPISNDLIRSADISSDQFITDDLVMVMKTLLDYYAFYGPGTQYAPMGLDGLVLAANKIATTTTAMTYNDPYNLKRLVERANTPMNAPGYICNSDMETWISNFRTTTGALVFPEVAQGKLLGKPLHVTNAIASGGTTYGTDLYSDLWYGDWSEFLWGEQMALMIDASREASYSDGGTNNISAFAADQTVIRAITLCDFNVRHASSFAKGSYAMKP
jgi:HK97 family phage major capsid protein